MNILPTIPSARDSGYALASVIILTTVAIAIYAGIHSLAETSVKMNDRNNLYNTALLAAEGATENVLGHVGRDFLNQSYNPNDLSRYRALLPTNDWAGEFRFCDGKGNVNRVQVEGSTTTVTTNLESQFRGLYGLVYTSRIRSKASRQNTSYGTIAAVVQQDLQLASIPIFQFAIFYSMDLEINPGAAMNVTGKVHGNANLYLAPPSTLRFLDDVAATGKVYFNRHPDDPTGGSKTTPAFAEPYVENVSSLTLPIATNNSPEVVRAILEEPPFGEDSNSPVGKSRYYNNCDLLISTTSTNVTVKSGKWNSFATVQPDVNPGKTNASYSFVSTNASFYDGREQKTTVVTDLDVAKFKTWLSNGGSSLNSLANMNLGHGINSVYIQDTRSPSGKLTAVRVVNGKDLPSDGLTVATKRPLYVKGHFNAPNTTVGSTNTASTKPASLAGDAVTVLSGNWSDAASTTPLNDAVDTTVNAAFLAGIVQTTNSWSTKYYSGGVENFPRFLEDWGGRTLTYNGSMVVMFPSRYATGFWRQTGVYYQAPTRKWAFDVNFLDHRKLPPATPQVRKLVRGQWSVMAAQ